MKTKFILHGGNMKAGGPENESFFAACVEGLADGDEVLWIGFARKQGSDRDQTFVRDTAWLQAATQSTLHFTNAIFGDLEQQLKRAKLVFVTGGNSQVLIDTIKQYSLFRNRIAGKTYAGSSAGACLVSTNYYHCSQQKVSTGLGVLPIRVMVHYGNPDFNATDEALAELKKHRPDLELLALPEAHWQIEETNL